MKHIILPTDFSENAFNAFRYALRLFENERFTLLLNCYAQIVSDHSIYATALNHDESDNMNRNRSEQGLENLVTKLDGDLHKPWQFFKKTSSPELLTNEIKNLAVKTDAALVIMGTKRGSGLK